jgi:cell wall-associated NlpC family hydrolase
VPPSNGNEDDSDLVATYGKPAPIAALVSPSEMAAEQAKQKEAADAAAQERLSANIAPPRLTLPPSATLAYSVAPTPTAKAKAKSKLKTATSVATTKTPPAPSPAPEGWANPSAHPQPRQQPSAFSRFWHSLGGSDSNVSMDTPANDPSNEWGYKFLRSARELGDRGIDYNDDWRPPGERSAWTMDCSNTSRWLYKSVTGINLPRTASDQYYYLHQQGKAWDVPTTDFGLPDVTYLQHNLKPGDLLFWENTYRPERSPPITHVMVFLGTNERGQWIMAGSQSSGGEHNRRDGGPDVYVFRPSQPCGGYTSWFVHHRGRFCAFGRPLEADPSKFALND